MELRTYLRILKRRWWIPTALVGLTLVFSLLTLKPWQPHPPTYVLGISFSVGVKPQPLTDAFTYDGYYSALASEYLVDDFGEVVKGSEFAAAVSKRLADQGIVVTPGQIQSATQTGKLHRILMVSILDGDRERLPKIADAVIATMTQDAEIFMPRLHEDQGAVYLINRGGIAAIGPSLKQRLELPLRLVLALLTGVGLAFLMEYLMPRVQSGKDLEALGVQVLAEIPRN
jgi:capsular polysaccharide biosynthesis protein